jgi:hypothetical protein
MNDVKICFEASEKENFEGRYVDIGKLNGGVLRNPSSYTGTQA